MTPNEITTEIAVQLYKELDDVFKLILFQRVGNWRSRLIRNSAERKPDELKSLYQTLYLPMEKKMVVPACVGNDIPGICPAAITKNKVPTPLRINSNLFFFVGSVDGSVQFSYGTTLLNDYLNTGKYSKDNVNYDWVDNRIIVEDKPNLPMIKVTGVFESPEEVAKMNCENGTGGCDFWNEEYPVPRDMAQQIVSYIVQEYKAIPANTDKQTDINQKLNNGPDGR